MSEPEEGPFLADPATALCRISEDFARNPTVEGMKSAMARHWSPSMQDASTVADFARITLMIRQHQRGELSNDS